MKDLFVGASGRLNNHGGSRMFTTPHTINVPPEYTVETDVPSVAEFVTCSLDGRLWVYRRSRRFYVAAFRWNEDTQRLVFVGTTILSNEAFVMRGADWILTDKSLIQSLDNEPYISRTTYTDSSFLDTINKSYSFFPEIETWQKIQGEQILTIQDSPYEQWQDLPQSLITPLEFHYYSQNDIQAFTEFSPQLCYCNGQLYGKGKAHIGRAYLLPRTFSEDGEPEDFYLYISPDYLRTYDSANKTFNDNDGWDNLRVAPFNAESVAIFTPQNDDYSICKKAENAQIITLPNGESLDLSADNGALFFDALIGSNLALNDSGASLLRDGLNYECKGLRQWIAPSGKVDAVLPQLVMSSFDNGTLATHIQGGFHRELLTGKMLPLSARDYSGKRLSLGESQISNKNSVQINELTSTPLPHNDERAMWEDLYKSFMTHDVIAGSRSKFGLWRFPDFPQANDSEYSAITAYWLYASCLGAGVDTLSYLSENINFPVYSIFLGEYPICCWKIYMDSFYDHRNALTPSQCISRRWNLPACFLLPHIIDYDTNEVDMDSIEINSQFSASFCFYDPNNKEFKVFDYTWDLSSYTQQMIDSYSPSLSYHYTIRYGFKNIIIQEGKICLILVRYDLANVDELMYVQIINGEKYYNTGVYNFNGHRYRNTSGVWTSNTTDDLFYWKKTDEFIVPGCDVPEEITDWQLSSDNISYYEREEKLYVRLPFHESITNTLFFLKTNIPSDIKCRYATFINTKTSINPVSSICLIETGKPQNFIRAYHIDFHPEIFDFNAEIERSKLF